MRRRRAGVGGEGGVREWCEGGEVLGGGEGVYRRQRREGDATQTACSEGMQRAPGREVL